MMSNSLILIATSCLSFLQPLRAGYHTCGDWMSSHDKNSLSNGVYNITSIIDRESDTDNWREVYCDFDYTRNYAWTLIESGSRSSYSSTLYQTAFINSVSYNEDDVYTYRTSLYRLSREWIYSLYFLSDYLYATCNFDTTFSQDWLLFSLDDSTLEYNPFYDEFSGQCVTAISANIRGYLCQDTTVQVWSTDGTWHLHIDSSSTSCGCTSWATGAASSEDNFGYYQTYNTEFTCTASSSSTTNYWFGSYVSNYKTPTLSPTEIPTIEPSDIPSNTPTDKPSSHPSDIPSDSPTYKPSINPSVLPTLSPSESIIVPTCEPSYSYSSEILECAKICVNNSMTTDEKSDLTTTAAASGLTDDTDNSGGNEQSNSSNDSSSSSDGLSTELIVILSVIGVLVFLCCIFCLFFTGVVSWHVRKRDEKMLQISANANNNNNNNNNVNNDNNNSKHSLLAPVASNSAMLYETNGSQQLFATNSMNNSMNSNNNNNGNNNPNGVNKEGPQITWQELATIHALTSRAMQLGNAPQNPNVNGISDIGHINNGNNNNNNNKGQSQMHFGENANGNGFDNNDNDNDNDDDIYNNNKNNNNENKDDAALTVAMNLAFNEKENNINNNNNNDNDLLAEGGIGGN